MKNFPMPVGSPILTNNKVLNTIFGFVLARIESPVNITNPMSDRSKIDGDNLHFKKGTWIGWYFSEELKNGEKFGYKITVLYALEFKSQYIFSEYVDYFYEMKKNATDNTERVIAKLLLNSLYGRFGMDINLGTTEIVNDSFLDEIFKDTMETSIPNFRSMRRTF